MVYGKVPEILLLYKPKPIKYDKFPIDKGSTPDKLLLLRLIDATLLES